MTVLGVIGYGRATDPCLSRVGPKSELADRSDERDGEVLPQAGSSA